MTIWTKFFISKFTIKKCSEQLKVFLSEAIYKCISFQVERPSIVNNITLWCLVRGKNQHYLNCISDIVSSQNFGKERKRYFRSDKMYPFSISCFFFIIIQNYTSKTCPTSMFYFLVWFFGLARMSVGTPSNGKLYMTNDNWLYTAHNTTSVD